MKEQKTKKSEKFTENVLNYSCLKLLDPKILENY